MNRISRQVDVIRTPAYVFDLEVVREAARLNACTCSAAGARLLYTLKACNSVNVLATLAGYVEGFSCSSIWEVEIGRRWANPGRTMHWISPLIMPSDDGVVFGLCHQVTLNSLSQLRAFQSRVRAHGNTGLRINPGLSMLDDSRYDPAAPGSRLGVRRDLLKHAYKNGADSILGYVRGLHFHTNCDSTDSDALAQVANQVVSDFGDLFDQIRWVNIGGGYLTTKWSSEEGFRAAVDLIRNCWSCEVYFEPGADLVRDAGYLVSSVGDVVSTPDGKVAILDTTVNHWPEVFEFGFEPDVLEHTEEGNYCYTLAGRSCLAGDIFGKYCFTSSLRPGDRIVFCGAGAYSLVKAHRFNGLALPTVYYMLNGECISEQESLRVAATWN